MSYLLLAEFLTALIGTAPINKAVLGWHPHAPPQNWKLEIARWDFLDTLRTWMGVVSFALLLAALAWR